MAQFHQRLAAGAGAVAACLVIGGPGLATATADPGGSRGGSDRGSSSDRDGGHGRPGSKGDRDDRGSRFDSGQRRQHDGGNGNGRSNRGGDGPQSRVGSGREDTPQPVPNERAGLNARGPVSDASASTESPTVSSGPAVDAPTVNVTVAPGTGATGGGGSAPAAGPAATLQPPRVTVGNGRQPGLQSEDFTPSRRAPVPPPVVAPPAPVPPPPPPPPSPAPPLLHRLATPPTMPMPLRRAPGANWNTLWGIAGLLLIPAAGAALGYRQARAAQMVDRLHQP